MIFGSPFKTLSNLTDMVLRSGHSSSMPRCSPASLSPSSAHSSSMADRCNEHEDDDQADYDDDDDDGDGENGYGGNDEHVIFP